MSEENKNDDWGMTTPNLRIDKEKLPKETGENIAPPIVSASSQPPADDWGITTPNVNIPKDLTSDQPSAPPPSDFDKTTPNINIPAEFTEKPNQSSEVPPANDWGITQTNIQMPKEESKDDWQMPKPVFRVSSGETPTVKPPTEIFSSQYAEEDDLGGKTSPYFRLPENSGETEAAPEPSPVVMEDAPAESPKKTKAPAKSGNGKWVLLLGGLFGIFMLATVGLVAGYFLFFNKSAEVSSVPPRNLNTNSDPPPVISTTPETSTNSTSSSNLPKSVIYEGEMMLVSAGEFTMGSNTGEDKSKPEHKIDLPAFYIDKYEVTNAQYKKFCDEKNKSYPPDHLEKGYFLNRPQAPVVGISFADAQDYATWAHKRLPTEEEWEKAASWDENLGAKLEFPWGNTFENGKAAFGLNTTSEVGKYSGDKSPYGVMDMAGNVLEWVNTFYNPYPGSPATDSEFGEKNRVVRGGFFNTTDKDFLKTTKRIYVPPDTVSSEDDNEKRIPPIGFRCAVSADDSRLAETLKSQSK